MQTIEILEEAVQTGIGHSSKGNQLKWQQDGWWYKADAFGFESLAETVVSELMAFSSVSDFVRYEPVNIQYKGKEYRGCRSRDFLDAAWELVPLERLSRIHTGLGLAQELARMADARQRILYTEEMVRSVTGIRSFGEYLVKMMEIDAFFLNEDRHTNNIAVLYDKEIGEYSLCPFYDMGLSLLSDTKEEYPLELSFAECREKIRAKPFAVDFDEQLDASEELYGTFLKFQFPAREIAKYCFMNSYTGYAPEELQRVEAVLRYQAGKYQYMFP